MSPFQESLTLAVVFLVFGYFTKLLGRRDNDPAPKINDLAISTSVSLMTLGKIFNDLFTSGSPSHELLLEATVGLLAPVFFAATERFVSWDVTVNPPKKKIWLGIVIPDIVAILVLFWYYRLRYDT